MYYGTDLKVKKGMGGISYKGQKSKERPGAARGQGMGLCGYQAGATGKAMSSVKGSGGKPTYYCGGSRIGR
jgi:hypothetical protein